MAECNVCGRAVVPGQTACPDCRNDLIAAYYVDLKVDVSAHACGGGGGLATAPDGGAATISDENMDATCMECGKPSHLFVLEGVFSGGWCEAHYRIV